MNDSPDKPSSYDPMQPYRASEQVRRQIARAFKVPDALEATQLGRILIMSGIAFGLADWISQATPPGREQSLALTTLQEVVMWATEAIATEGKA